METIPTEIFQEILDCIGSSAKELLPYVTVCRRWQIAIEKRSFYLLKLKISELSTFENLFRSTQAHRKVFLKQLCIPVVLPTYDGEHCQQHKETNNQVFSTAVHKLFQILQSFDEDVGVKNEDGLDLFFRFVQSPSDPKHPGLFDTFVRVLNHEKLPTVSCVSCFRFFDIGSSRKFDPVSLMFAASKLKDLKRCRISYYNSRDNISVEIQKSMWNAFEKAISAYTHSMDQLWIDFFISSPYDEASAPPTFSSPVDPLNLALHNLIQNAFISNVTLSMHTISPEFFWPYDNPNVVPTKLPFWPNLKDMLLRCSPATPDGDWYFMGDPNIASHAEFAGQNKPLASCGGVEQSPLAHRSGNSDDIFNTFRSIPNPEKMNPLLIAMARAVRFAPSVRSLQLLFAPVKLTPKFIKKAVDITRVFKVTYSASSIGRRSWASPFEKSRLICQVGNWRMDEEVERHWKDALGPDGVIIYEE